MGSGEDSTAIGALHRWTKPATLPADEALLAPDAPSTALTAVIDHKTAQWASVWQRHAVRLDELTAALEAEIAKNPDAGPKALLDAIKAQDAQFADVNAHKVKRILKKLKEGP